jgi:transcriptional regulator with XRE-family HTH domain
MNNDKSYDAITYNAIANETLAMIIREKREKLGYSRAKLSALTGVPSRTIEAWEKSERKPQKISNIIKVCKALDIPIELFM